MNILAVIPARGGSKGIPGKNIKLLGRKPLLAYTSEVALQAGCFDRVVLTTDDDAILKVGEELGLEIPYKRPAELAQDTTPTLPVIKHLLAFYKKSDITFDAVCLLQTTSPFRTVSWLKEAVSKFKSNDFDSLISVQEVPHEYNPHWTFKQDEQGLLKIATGDEEIITRRQELPKAYHRDGLLYITKATVIMESHSLYGKKIGYIHSDADSYVNLDTPADWQKAESILKMRN